MKDDFHVKGGSRFKVIFMLKEVQGSRFRVQVSRFTPPER